MDFEELQTKIDFINAAPHDRGAIYQLCIRPCEGERLFSDSLNLSVTEGVIGDRWKHHTWMHLQDGSPDPRLQVCILQKRVLDLVWTDRQNTPHPADNIIVDMNLSVSNLPSGSRLQAGSAILEVSDVFNTGCAKWKARYGEASLRWINYSDNRHHRLRGVLCRVISDGQVSHDDVLCKLL